jgi:hypothetical protein
VCDAPADRLIYLYDIFIVFICEFSSSFPNQLFSRLIGGGEPEPPKSFVDNLTEELSLSRTNRLIGFATCLAMGFFFNFLAVSVFLVIPRKFAIAFTLGNIMSIGSTMFLMGPWAQMKKMCSPERAPATTVYFVSMFLTLYCALALRSFILTIPCVVIQLCALIYYGECNQHALVQSDSSHYIQASLLSHLGTRYL